MEEQQERKSYQGVDAAELAGAINRIRKPPTATQRLKGVVSACEENIRTMQRTREQAQALLAKLEGISPEMDEAMGPLINGGYL